MKAPLSGRAGRFAAGALAALTVAALVNRILARKAERDNPAAGQFVEVDGVRLHYVDRGSGEPVVLLHGNGSMIQDFEASGLIAMAAGKYRVIAFDRPVLVTARAREEPFGRHKPRPSLSIVHSSRSG